VSLCQRRFARSRDSNAAAHPAIKDPNKFRETAPITQVASPVESSQIENQQQSSPQTLKPAVSDEMPVNHCRQTKSPTRGKSQPCQFTLHSRIERKRTSENKKGNGVVHDSLPEKPFNPRELSSLYGINMCRI
jgi:hypothetical protein